MNKTRRRILAAALLLALAPSIAMAGIAEDFPLKKNDAGDAVIIIQQRLTDLGYLHFRATGSFGDMTRIGVLAFQERNDVDKDGMVGEETYSHLYDAGLIRAALNESIVRVVGPGLLATPEEYGTMSDWSEIAPLFPVGDTVTVTDFNTLRTYEVTRTGGENHADVQTVDAQSQENFLKCFGGEYTWEKRPVLVRIGDEEYAGSIFGMPNANDTLQNGHMSGSVCLYFNGSTSDMGGIADVEHQVNVTKAAGQ